ncbi:hypothetical protein IAR50_000499 [Cryptococcus sp. DSM 104548]
MSRQPTGDNTPSRDVVLPHPAEDLSADDDLLSWVLVDQLGSMPNTKLGVHPQQVKFVGPAFKTDEVLNIVRETVTKGNIQAAMQKLQEWVQSVWSFADTSRFHLFQQHMNTKITPGQKERFIKHLRRYLLILQPASRLEIHLTSRYTFITGHTELAVFATRPLIPGTVMQELQGSVVPLPNEWREEMDIGDDYAVEAAGEESDSEEEVEEEEGDRDTESAAEGSSRRRKAREERRQQGQRRSDRTKRRDFSIVWSGLKRCYQLFLGPARFLNHDCNPNVELLRQGNYVTFRVTKPIKIGDELTTFYLCLTCEQQEKGGFAPKPPMSRTPSRRGTRGLSTTSDSQYRSRRGSSRDSTFAREPSSLKNEITVKAEPMSEEEEEEEEEEEIDFGPSMATVVAQSGSGSESVTFSAVAEVSNAVTPFDDGEDRSSSQRDSSLATEDEEIGPPRRERYARKATQALKPWLQPKHKAKQEQEVQYVGTNEDFPSGFPRCATCAKPLTDQIWYNGKYFDHCQRCVRHALVFDLPWPAHRPQDVQEYPPAHLVPPGFIPRKISTIPLPSLSKVPRIKPVKFIVREEQDGYHDGTYDRRARRLRDEIDAETFVIESLREAAWSAQEAREAAQEAKEEEKRRKQEEKRKLDATRIKGAGVWSRYEYVDEEAMRKKEEDRWKVQPGLTRRGTVRKVSQSEKPEDEKDQGQETVAEQEVPGDSESESESEEERKQRIAKREADLAKKRELNRLAKEKKLAQDAARKIRVAEARQLKLERLRQEREEKERRNAEGESSSEEEEEDSQVCKRATRSGAQKNPIVFDDDVQAVQPSVWPSARAVVSQPTLGTQAEPIVIDDDDMEDEIRVAVDAHYGRAHNLQGSSKQSARRQVKVGAGPSKARASTSAHGSTSTPKQTPRSQDTGVRSSGRKTKPTPKALEPDVAGSRRRRKVSDPAADASSVTSNGQTPRLILKTAAAKSTQTNGTGINGASSSCPSSTPTPLSATPAAPSSDNSPSQSQFMKKRGRPPGTGKWQIAAAARARAMQGKVDESLERDVGAGPSTVNGKGKQRESLHHGDAVSTSGEPRSGAGKVDSKSPGKLKAKKDMPRDQLNGKEKTNGVAHGSAHEDKGKEKAVHPNQSFGDYSSVASRAFKKVVPPASFFASAGQSSQSKRVHPPPWPVPPAIPRLFDSMNGPSGSKKGIASASASRKGEVATTPISLSKPSLFSTNGDLRQSLSKGAMLSEELMAKSARDDPKEKKRARPDSESTFPSPSQPLSKKSRTDVFR